MKTLYEKEKKLNDVLEKLYLLNPQTPDLRETIANLDYQKNQLEIEKKDLETRYKNLLKEHRQLKVKLEELNQRSVIENKKELEFSEKIDELNQETDTLLEEIDKWQM